jgi:iron complex outermembrane receptor protein
MLWGDYFVRKTHVSHTSRAQASRARRIGATPVGAAVFLALYGAPHPAFCDEPVAAFAGALAEVTVTANRRAQTVEEVPYSLTVVSTDQLERTGVTDLASLASQVPGLSLYDLGARFAAQTTPIIRGLNATGAPASNSAFRTFEQSPVGTYIGNSPIDGYFQLDDVARVEILRGPQGTLYGA